LEFPNAFIDFLINQGMLRVRNVFLKRE